MFGKRTLIVFLSMIALGTAIDPDNICVLVADGTKIVDDTNCSGYYTCKGGKATASTCPSGYYFNKDMKTCVTKSQATCINPDEAPCAGMEDGKFVPMSGSCSGYYYCKNQLAIAGECPNNLIFNPDKQQCVYKEQYTCNIAGGNTDTDIINDDPQVVCAYVPEGMFFGNAASCTTWHKCKSSGIITGTCTGFVFDVQKQECVVEGTYTCQQLDGDSTQTGGTPLGDCTEVMVPVPEKTRIASRERRNARTFYNVWSKSRNVQELTDDTSGAGDTADTGDTGDADNTGGAGDTGAADNIKIYCDKNDLEKCWTISDVENETDCSKVCSEPNNCFNVCKNSITPDNCPIVCKDSADSKCWSVCDDTEDCSNVCEQGGLPDDCETVCKKDENSDKDPDCDPGSNNCTTPPATQPKKYKDPDSCNTYLTCKNKKYVRTKCPMGQFFSLTDQECTAREHAVNKCDRCQDSSLTFVNAHSDDCQGYFYCSKGKKVGKGDCSKGYKFNEKMGSCVTTEVKFKACLSSSYTSYDDSF